MARCDLIWSGLEVNMCYMDVQAASSIQEQTLYEFQRWQPVSLLLFLSPPLVAPVTGVH